MASATPARHSNINASACKERVVVSDDAGYTSGLLGATVDFPDGSRWKLTKALTYPKYQQGQPPFEGRQTFECICIHDPCNLYGSTESAIIKAKYQVEGTEESVDFYAQYLSRCQHALSEGCTSHEDIPQHLEQAKDLLFKSTRPVAIPHEYTTNEIIALRRLRKMNCLHTPHFLNNAWHYLKPGIDKQGMAGGYAVFILMTKVPGEPISYDSYKAKSREQRDEIREAFKTAQLDLWRCRVDPEDRALRNLMWDEQARRCYIVDFEDWSNLQVPMVESDWEPSYWKYWELSEKCVSRW